MVTRDDRVIMASEVGAIEIPEEDIVRKGRLQPGRMFLVDTRQGRIIDDQELKSEICNSKPYREWLDANSISLESLPLKDPVHQTDYQMVLQRQKIFGYTMEDLMVLMLPMIETAGEATGSMGNDTPLAVLSSKPRLLFDYFKQIFAQVSNPAIDSIREELVMSLTSRLGRMHNLLQAGPEHGGMLKLEHPLLTNEELTRIRNNPREELKPITLSMLFPRDEGEQGLEKALNKLCQEAEQACLLYTSPSPRD